MPITSSAKKAFRRDKRRQEVNYKTRAKVKTVIDIIRKGSNDPKDLSNMQSTLDRAGKERILHPKKVSRLKSRLNKLVKSRTSDEKKEKPKTKKSPAKKSPTKKVAVKK